VTTRQKNAIVLTLAVFATVLALYFLEKNRSPSAPGGARVLDAVPADTFLLATFDVGPLRASPLMEPLRSLSAGMGKDVRSQCGFDPLERLDTVAVALPESDGIGDFGVVSVGSLKKDELLKCARTVMQARSANLAAHDVSGFTVVEDKGTFGGAYGKLAVRDFGPFLLAREPWISSMIEAWEKKRPRIESNARHMDLRRSLGTPRGASTNEPARAKPAVLVTALLPAKLRERLKREMSTEGTAGSNAAMLGVLGVESAGIAVTIDAAGMIDLAAELRCETVQACLDVEHLIAKKRDEWAGDFRMRLIGLGGILQGLTVEAKGPQVSSHTRIAADDARRLIDRLLELRAGAHAGSNVVPVTSATSGMSGPQPAPPDKDAGAR